MDWNTITPKEFEILCYRLLEKEGFDNVKWYGGIGDRARDITAVYRVKVAGSTEFIRYLIQCKRIVSGGLSVEDIRSVKDWMDSDNNFDRALIVTSTNLTPQTRDWINGINSNKATRYKIETWDRAEIETYLSRHSDLLEEYFPKAKVLNSMDTGDVVLYANVVYSTGTFETKGGDVVIVGGITASSSASGMNLSLMPSIDGKEMNPMFISLPSLPSGHDLFWRVPNMSAGEHKFELKLSPDKDKGAIYKLTYRVLEFRDQK